MSRAWVDLDRRTVQAVSASLRAAFDAFDTAYYQADTADDLRAAVKETRKHLADVLHHLTPPAAPAVARTVTNLVRTNQGRMVHRADCRHATNGAPWRWAEGREPTEVLLLKPHVVRLCRTCKPLSATP